MNNKFSKAIPLLILVLVAFTLLSKPFRSFISQLTINPTSQLAQSVSTWTDIGFNFRSTAGYVSDGINETYVRGDVYPTSRAGATFGWLSPLSDGIRDRNSSNDRRLAGVNQVPNNGTQGTFRVDLPSPGDYDINLALGDAAFPQAQQYVQILDGGTTLFTINDTNGTGTNHFNDANSTDLTQSTWPSSNSPRRVTLSGATLNIVLGTLTPQTPSSTIAHLRIVKVGSSTPPPATPPPATPPPATPPPATPPPATPPPPPPPPTTPPPVTPPSPAGLPTTPDVYEHGFEDGTFGSFISQNNQPLNTLGWSVDSSNTPALGARSITHNIPVNTGNQSYNAYYTFPQARSSAYIRFAYKQSSTFDNALPIKVLRVQKNKTELLGSLIFNGDGADALRVHSEYRDNMGQNYGPNLNGPAPTPNSLRGGWHWYELFLDVSNPTQTIYKLWVDDVQYMDRTITHIAKAVNDFNEIFFGATFNSISTAGTVWYDSIAVSSQRMGIPSGSPTPPPATPPTPNLTPLAGDLNLDHIVNSLDWSTMNSKWFTADATADINADGLVNSIDFSIMNNNWLKTW